VASLGLAYLCRRWRRNTTDGIPERQRTSHTARVEPARTSRFLPQCAYPISATLRLGYCHTRSAHVLSASFREHRLSIQQRRIEQRTEGRGPDSMVMSQFPKRGLDLPLGQAHHRCASYPTQGIGGTRPSLTQACASAGALGGGAAALADLGRAACGLDCRSAWPSEGGGHKPGATP
jgi:hypothetical protein